MNTVSVTLGEELFSFSSEQEWVNRGPRIWRVHRATNGQALAIDTKGRICQCGGDFMRATREGSYPVRVFRVQPDSPLNGTPPDLSDKALFGADGLDTDYDE